MTDRRASGREASDPGSGELPPAWSELLRALPQPAALLGQAGTLLATNGAWGSAARACGLAEPAAGGPFELPVAMPEARTRALAEVASVLAGGPAAHALQLVGDPVGASGPCLCVERLQGAGAARALVLLVDASAQEGAQALRAEREERFRQLAESIDEVFWMTSPAKDRMLYVSPGYERIWGRTCASLYAEPRQWLTAIHPEDRARVQAALPGQSEGAYDIEYRILNADGGVRWIRDRAFPIRGADGSVIRVAGVAQDVTPYHRALESAQRSEEGLRRLHEELELRVAARTQELSDANAALSLAEQRLRQVIDLVPHFVFAKDIEGRFLLVNQAVAEAYGTSVEALIGRKDEDFARSEEEVRHFREDDLEVIRSGTAKVIPEETITDASGRQRVLATIKIPFTRSGSAVPAVLGVALDVTERKRLETQLQQAQRLEGLGRLAGGIAHDFNNLLTVVVGCVQLLESPDLSADQSQNLARIREAAERAAALTHQLLTFARGQAAAPRVLDPGALVLEMDRLLRRVLGEHVTLTTEAQAGGWNVEIDPAQLEQVLLNLALNARDAMPRGGRLTISVRDLAAREVERAGGPLAPEGDCVELGVADTGVGMDQATLARAFEPFFTTKAAGHGTGLGLATCYGIVKRFGGHIWAESASGQGSTFRILLPRSHKPLSDLLPAAPPASSTNRGGETVLVVEDHPAVRDVAVQSLTRHGYHVMEAASPQEALQRARAYRGRIDLLLSDVVMPGASGPELAGVLRKERPDLRVLYVSGYSRDALSESGPDLAQDLLAKPFTPAALARRVRAALDRAP